jgi:hypothetical protein
VQSNLQEEVEGTLDQRLEQDLVCELAEMSGSEAQCVVLSVLARQHWQAVTVLPVEVADRLQRQDGPAWDLSTRHLAEWAVVVGPSHSDIAVLVGRLPAGCSNMMVVAPRSSSYGPYPASEDVLASCCWEVVMTHYPHRPVLVEEGLEEACSSRQVGLHPFPGTLVAGHRVSVLAVLLVSKVSEWVAVAAAAAAAAAAAGWEQAS